MKSHYFLLASRCGEILPDSQNKLSWNLLYFSSSNMQISVISVWPKPCFCRRPFISKILSTRFGNKNILTYSLVLNIFVFSSFRFTEMCQLHSTILGTIVSVLSIRYYILCIKMYSGLLPFILNVLKNSHIFWHVCRFFVT